MRVSAALYHLLELANRLLPGTTPAIAGGHARVIEHSASTRSSMEPAAGERPSAITECAAQIALAPLRVSTSVAEVRSPEVRFRKAIGCLAHVGSTGNIGRSWYHRLG